ncbi:30S ribosomal protein S2 [Roseovarius spongiae]|uniref:Small ribosomal subunit protein uS2 n=1 Tax=Roseovarius spongiae TaxID=2320272 RepID=A0A3A8AZS5_9RHOB|nr:30S ribosomal protein S2 [Roseovarius spongiae]RKF17159.1 30S ribosomal protein S2 [Roseovarius spongiae]
MALPEFSMRQLLEAGVHFGHQTQRWNPRMGEFIYGARNGIHIMDLTQTVPMLDAALNVVRETVAKNGRILFVGTKRQASAPIAEAAEKCAQYYMNHRWLGGTLTNWQTVSKSIHRLKEIDETLEGGAEGLTKKERLGLERDQAKLEASLGGIREMGGVPDLLFVIDVRKEQLAVAEAKKLGIPIVAVVDTNCSPDGIDYIIPGNDDAARAIALYCDLVSRAALDGMSAQLDAAGVDIGAMEEAPVEEAAAPEAGVEVGAVSEETAHDDVMSKDAPLDIESSEEVSEMAQQAGEAGKEEKADS